MRTLKAELKKLLPDFTNLGDEGRSIDRERLIHVLDRLASDLTKVYIVRIISALIVFVVLLFLIHRFVDQPAVLTGLAAATGITVAGTIAVLKQVTDEMARVRLLLAVAPELSLETLTEIAQRLATSL